MLQPKEMFIIDMGCKHRINCILLYLFVLVFIMHGDLLNATSVRIIFSATNDN